MPAFLFALAFASLLQSAPGPAAGSPSGSTVTEPVRDRTFPPPAARQVAQVQGQGVQIYSCSLQQGGMSWVLEAPEAALRRTPDGPQVGTHDAGPRWTWTDGSSIRGNVVASQPAADPANIPSLLIETFPAGNTPGYLSNVLWVRRSGTSGGVAPSTPCDAQHAHTLVRVPYQATYTFYASATAADQP